MELDKAARAGDRLETVAERVGGRLVRAFQLLALFVIGATIVWAAAYEYLVIFRQGHADLHDILLLFIYLELGAMVGIYFHTSELPVEFLLYVAITVLTRSLVDIEAMSDTRVIMLAVSILVLAGAVLLLRYAAHRFRNPAFTDAAAGAADPPE